MVAQRFAVQPLGYLARTPVLVQQATEQQQRGRQKQQCAQQQGDFHTLRNMRHSARQPTTCKPNAVASIICPEPLFHMANRYFGLDTKSNRQAPQASAPAPRP